MLIVRQTSTPGLVEVFNQAAGITENPSQPLWFTENNLHMLHKQPDEDKLIATAERIWPYVDWMPEAMTDRNRAAWYASVIRQRRTSAGWILDRKVTRRH